MRNDRDNTKSSRTSLVCLIGVAGSIAISGGCASGRIDSDPVYFPSSGATARVVHLKSFNRIDDVVAIEPTFVELIRGERFTSRVANAAGVAARGDDLYICDTEQAVVHVWSLATGLTHRLGQSVDVRLDTPVDVAVSASGDVYVADTGRGEVVAFGSEGASPSRIRPETTDRFQPVAVGVSGDRLFVADLETASIIAFDVATGAVSTTLTLSDKAGDAVMPMGVAVGPTGEILVTDAMGGRVLVLSNTGELLRTISQRGDRLGDMGHPKHLDVGEDGTVFISDAEFARVHLYTQSGQLLMLIGGPDDLAGGTPMPLGVAVIGESTALDQLVPDDFAADYFVVVTNSLGSKRVSLFAVGMRR